MPVDTVGVRAAARSLRALGGTSTKVPRLLVTVLALLLLGPVVLSPARAATGATYPFQNPRLSLKVRIDDLMSRLTLDEKVLFLHQYQPEIPRLGIKLAKSGTEALHGLAWTNDYAAGGAGVTATATVFPQAVGLASTWDPALIKQVGSAVGDEARGYHAENPRVWGLNLWAPVVNLLRDPRWGRNEEGYSEDPFLTGAISTAYGKGMEGDDPRYLKTAPTLKHYLAYNNEVHRDTSTSNLPPRVLHEYDEAAFKPAISADAATGVMASYNLVNGRPNTVSPDLNDTVRSWTDKTLFNVSDAFAPYNLTGSEGYYATQPEADAATIKAGLDSFTIDDEDPQPMATAIHSALDQGLLTTADIDTAVRHALSIRFRLGDFDPDGGPYATITKAAVDTPAHRQLARQTADEAAVLLKNSGILPLNAAKTRKVAVVGPLADTNYTDLYSGKPSYQVTPLAGITERLGSGASVTSSEGVDRIALKDAATGRYVVGGTGSGGALLSEGATADATAQFDAFDWGQGVLALRNAANGKYVGRFIDAAGNWTDTFANDQAQPNSWFVQQQFTLEPQGDGTYAIRYAGYEMAFDWAGPNKYLTVDANGTLRLGAPTADAAAHFSKELLRSGQDAAVTAARGADAAVVVVGSMPLINGREDHDRTTMDLAEGQQALIKAVRAANPHTVVVVENSYPDTLNWEQANVPGILWTTHAGQETGHAVADVLFGDHSPAGRLTQTWYRSAGDLPDILDYDVISSDRTYQYYRGATLYPFGYGLSYTSFAYRNLRLGSTGGSAGGSPVVGRNGTVTAKVDVTNTGSRAGDEVVQLYTHQRTSRVKQPVRTLRAFQRVHLRPGQTTTVTLPLRVADLATWDVTRSRWVVESSAFDVMVGASSTDVRARGAFRVHGETVPPRDLSTATRAENFDAYHGVTLVDETKARGTAVGAGNTGDWIEFADVRFRPGVDRVTAQVSKADGDAGTLQLRLDDPTSGPVIGTVGVPATGSRYTPTTASAAVQGANGVHDLYVVFTGGTNLSSLRLTGDR